MQYPRHHRISMAFRQGGDVWCVAMITMFPPCRGAVSLFLNSPVLYFPHAWPDEQVRRMSKAGPYHEEENER